MKTNLATYKTQKAADSLIADEFNMRSNFSTLKAMHDKQDSVLRHTGGQQVARLNSVHVGSHFSG